jgi:hypothetical protein
MTTGRLGGNRESSAADLGIPSDSKSHSYEELRSAPPLIGLPGFDGFPENVGLLEFDGGVWADAIFGVCMYQASSSPVCAALRALVLDGLIGAAGAVTGAIDLGVAAPFPFAEADTP